MNACEISVINCSPAIWNQLAKHKSKIKLITVETRKT